MSKSYKILGQSYPSTGDQEILYTVPSGKQCVISSITACCQVQDSRRYSIAIVKSGETLSPKCYLVYEKDISMSDTEPFKLGITLSEGDMVYTCSNGNVSFNAFGTEF
jgi:hypothetical protein